MSQETREEDTMNPTIGLGISGGIAAYKSAELVRLFVKNAYEVHCILTGNAERFVAPLTLSTLSGHPVLRGCFESGESGKIRHIELAEKADLVLAAPATANVIAKIAHGIADDLLSATLLAAQGIVAVCPAMNVYMWENKATQENLRILETRGIALIGPASGELACGYEGMGRMEDPETVVREVEALLSRKQLFQGKKILITAGPTREHLDPVRFLSNPSTGKMGYALARAALQYGAQVILVTGPSEVPPPYGANLVRVTTAEEMFEAVRKHFSDSDILISAAAVSDWKPKKVRTGKQKKGGGKLWIEFEPTADILASVSRSKKDQTLVGFAAETGHLEENAIKKLNGKNLDLIVGNLVSGNGHGAFGSEENEMTILTRSGQVKKYPRMSKNQAARVILEAVANLKKL